jgi:ABC-type antimicrobial peptide transport system permease subunit
VLREFKIVAWGCALGLLLALGAGRSLTYLLPEIGAIDYLVMSGAAGVLLATSLAAASIPASRVLRLDPLEVLRP